jgi:hypothetical protein
LPACGSEAAAIQPHPLKGPAGQGITMPSRSTKRAAAPANPYAAAVHERNARRFRHGLISMGMPSGVARHISSTSSSVTAMQPAVQSTSRCSFPIYPKPLRMPWIIIAPPGSQPLLRADSTSRVHWQACFCGLKCVAANSSNSGLCWGSRSFTPTCANMQKQGMRLVRIMQSDCQNSQIGLSGLIFA